MTSRYRERICGWTNHPFYGDYCSIRDLFGEDIKSCPDCKLEIKKLRQYLKTKPIIKKEKKKKYVRYSKPVKKESKSYADYLKKPKELSIMESWLQKRRIKPYNAITGV